MGNYPFPRSDEALVKCFFLEGRPFYGERSWFFHSIYISFLPTTDIREFDRILGGKTHESVGVSLSFGFQQFLPIELVHIWPPTIHKISIYLVRHLWLQGLLLQNNLMTAVIGCHVDIINYCEL